jgi:hypothetical protein
MEWSPRKSLSLEEQEIRELFEIARRMGDTERVNDLWPKLKEARKRFAYEERLGRWRWVRIRTTGPVVHLASCLIADLQDPRFTEDPRGPHKPHPLTAEAPRDFLFDTSMPPADVEGLTISVYVWDRDQEDEAQMKALRRLEESLAPQPPLDFSGRLEDDNSEP